MRIDLNFLAEARSGDTITVGSVKDEAGVWQFEITSEERVLCRAKIEFR